MVGQLDPTIEAPRHLPQGACGVVWGVHRVNCAHKMYVLHCTGSTVLTSTQPCAQDVRASLLRVNWLPPSGNWSIMETCPSSHHTICSSTPTLKVIRNILIEVIIAYVCKESKYSISSLLVRFIIFFSKVEEYITNVSSFLCHVPRVLCYVARVLCLLSSPPTAKTRS